MHWVLVYHLGGLSPPRNSVSWLIDQLNMKNLKPKEKWKLLVQLPDLFSESQVFSFLLYFAENSFLCCNSAEFRSFGQSNDTVFSKNTGLSKDTVYWWIPNLVTILEKIVIFSSAWCMQYLCLYLISYSKFWKSATNSKKKQQQQQKTSSTITRTKMLHMQHTRL